MNGEKQDNLVGAGGTEPPRIRVGVIQSQHGQRILIIADIRTLATGCWMSFGTPAHPWHWPRAEGRYLTCCGRVWWMS